MKDLIIPSNNVSFQEIKTQYDNEPIFRAYCIQYPNLFNIQIRGTVPLQTEKRLSKNKPRNLIATVSLTKEQILRLVEMVNGESINSVKP